VLDRLQADFARIALPGGDPGAIAAVAQSLLDVGREAFGSSSGFFELFDGVSSKLEELLIDVPDATAQTNDLLQELLDEIGFQNARENDSTETTLDRLSQIVKELQLIRQQNPAAFNASTV